MVSLPLCIQGPAPWPLPLLDTSSPGWHVPGRGLWELAVLAPLCPQTPGPSIGGGEPLPGREGVGQPCCSILGKPLGSASSPEGSALLLQGCQGFQLNFLAPLKPAILCAFFNTAKHLKRCLLLFL